jgi:hypothetical protein
MRRYLFPVCCFIIYSIIVGLDFFSHWPPTEKEDILMLISILTIFITVNYSLSTKFHHFNIYKNYKNLMVTPLVPRQCFIKELSFYLRNIENVIFFLTTYFFILYFLRIINILIITFSLIFYFVFFSYALIVIRFVCGHSTKGKGTFYTICLLVNAIVMYQILLISKGSSNLAAIIFVEYNPLNTIFFLSIINGMSVWFVFFPYMIILVIFYLFTRNLSWEKQLESM